MNLTWVVGRRGIILAEMQYRLNQGFLTIEIALFWKEDSVSDLQ